MAGASYVELVQGRVGPAHCHLHHRVQPGQLIPPRTLTPRTTGGLHLPQFDLDLEDLGLGLSSGDPEEVVEGSSLTLGYGRCE